MIKLYGISTSRAGRCAWALEEIGLDYEQIPMHFNDGSARRPEYLALNPNGRIPTLVDGDLVLYESMAINHYLADRYDGGLRPRNEAARARAVMWSFWGTNEIENLLRPLLRNRLFLPEADREPALADRAESALARPLEILDEALREGDYILGDAISVADLNLGHGLFWLPAAGVPIDTRPHLADWLECLAERPALKRVQGVGWPELDTKDQRPPGEVDPRRGF